MFMLMLLLIFLFWVLKDQMGRFLSFLYFRWLDIGENLMHRLLLDIRNIVFLKYIVFLSFIGVLKNLHFLTLSQWL